SAIVLTLHNIPGGRLSIDFPPPWRLASSLPPLPPQGETQITVTDQAVPGDIALLLPFGSALAGFRKDIALEQGRFAQCAKPELTNPFAPQIPTTGVPTFKNVTCFQSIPTGKGVVRLATVRDLPSF